MSINSTIENNVKNINENYAKIREIEILENQLKKTKEAHPHYKVDLMCKRNLNQLENNTSQEIQKWKTNRTTQKNLHPTIENRCLETNQKEIARKVKNIKLALRILWISVDILVTAAIVISLSYSIALPVTALLWGFGGGSLVISFPVALALIDRVPFANYFEAIRLNRCSESNFKYFVSSYLNDVELSQKDLLDLKLHQIYCKWEEHFYPPTPWLPDL